MTTDEQRRKDFIAGLVNLAAFLKSRPELPVPLNLWATVYLTADEFRDAQQHMGSYIKSPLDDIYGIEKHFPGKVAYRLITARANVCTKRVVGTRTIPERTEELVEWDCGSILEPKETA